jgi:hypothetical protein
MRAGAEQTRTERNRGVMSQENVETIQSLFSGVEERDLEAMRRHAEGWVRTWASLLPGDERKLDAVFIDAGDDVVARWRLRARALAGSGDRARSIAECLARRR